MIYHSESTRSEERLVLSVTFSEIDDQNIHLFIHVTTSNYGTSQRFVLGHESVESAIETSAKNSEVHDVRDNYFHTPKSDTIVVLDRGGIQIVKNDNSSVTSLYGEHTAVFAKAYEKFSESISKKE